MDCGCKYMLRNPDSKEELYTAAETQKLLKRLHWKIMFGKMHFVPDTSDIFFRCNECGQGWYIMPTMREDGLHDAISRSPLPMPPPGKPDDMSMHKAP